MNPDGKTKKLEINVEQWWKQSESNPECTESLKIILCNYFTCMVDLLAIIRQLEFVQFYCTNFALISCCMNATHTVAVDIHSHPNYLIGDMNNEALRTLQW